MTSNGPEDPRPPKHLLSQDDLDRVASANDSDTDLTRHHGQGNGLRVHGIYFAIVSIVVLVLVIVGVAIASSMM